MNIPTWGTQMQVGVSWMQVSNPADFVRCLPVFFFLRALPRVQHQMHKLSIKKLTFSLTVPTLALSTLKPHAFAP